MRLGISVWPRTWLKMKFRDLAKIIGPSNAEKLVQVRGGVKIYIPSAKNLNGQHWLAALLGVSAARKLCAKFAGTTINIPLKTHFSKHSLIKILLDEGHSLREIALAADVHIRTVSRVKSANKST